MKIRITKCHEDAIIPQYQTEGSVGFDLHAGHNTSIGPGQTELVGTGLKVEIPKGYELQIRSRSGLAFRNNIIVLNSPGTIDSDYRGEIQVILINHGPNTFDIRKNDRIAQGVICPIVQAQFEVIEESELSQTVRGSGGFGSTGV